MIITDGTQIIIRKYFKKCERCRIYKDNLEISPQDLTIIILILQDLFSRHKDHRIETALCELENCRCYETI